MKFFANKNIFKKIVLTLFLLLSFSYVSPEPVQAGVGGELMEPICSMLVGFGDGIVNVLHKFIIKQDNSLIRVGDEINWAKVIIVIVAIAVIAIIAISGVGALLEIASAASANILLAISTGVVTVTKIAGTGAIAAILFFSADGFSDELPLPMYTITPEKIVKNEIPLFDVNFINPTQKTIEYEIGNNTSDSEKYSPILTEEEVKKLNLDFDKNYTDVTQQLLKDFNTTELFLKSGRQIEVDGVKYVQYYKIEYSNDYGTTETKVVRRVNNQEAKSNITDKGEIHAISYELQETIAKWYNILRMMAIVGMMSVLVYIGIRIVLSATSSQKAKYKQLLGDWFVGMILLFTMHYIMNFSNIAVEKLTDILSSVNPTQNIAFIADKVSGKEGLIKKKLDEIQLPDKNGEKILYVYHEDDEITKQYGNKGVEWHTDLMGLIRIKAAENKGSSSEAYIGYTIMFVVMIIYTLVFAWTYIKRVIYIAFLTLISPLVALTYPIDKANDGKAQGFDYWFKEYIFNLLLQPMHLLIYTVLISSAIELCEKNWIYALVATGFIVSAEKIVRTMFNFSKASTPGIFAGPAGAALTISGMKWLMGHGPKSEQNKGKLVEDSKSSIGGTNKTKMRELINGNYANSNVDEPGGAVYTAEMNDNNDSENEISEVRNRDNNDTENTINEVNNSLVKIKAKRKISGPKTNKISNMQNSEIPRKTSASVNTGSKASVSKESGTRVSKDLGARVSTGTRTSSDVNNGKTQQMGTWKLGLANMGNKLLSNKRNQILQDAKEGKSLKAIGRGAVGAFSGATLGALGLAAGVASGDPSKAFQNAAIGVAGGFKLGSGVGSKIAEGLDIQGLSEAYGRGSMGSKEYDARQAKIYAKEYASRTEVVKKVQEEFDINSWKEAEKKAQELANYYGIEEGYYDVKDWKKFETMADKLQKENGIKEREVAQKHAIASKKIYDNFYDKTKQRKDIEKAMRDSMGINNSQARIMSDAMYKWGDIVS